MALLDRHVYSFNLSLAKPNPQGTVPFNPSYHLPVESHRYPMNKLDGLEKLLRTWFLGHAEDTITEHILDITNLMERIKQDTMKLPGR
jgi:hypothetical protein